MIKILTKLKLRVLPDSSDIYFGCEYLNRGVVEKVLVWGFGNIPNYLLSVRGLDIESVGLVDSIVMGHRTRDNVWWYAYTPRVAG